MTISLRLDEKTRAWLLSYARRKRTSQSAVVREALHALADQEARESEARPYEAMAQWIGRIHGGPKDLSARTGAGLKRLLQERRSKP